MKTSYTMRRTPTMDYSRKAATEQLGPGALVLRAGLLMLFLVSVYVEVPLYLNESLIVPSFFTLLVLVPILAFMYHRSIYKHEAAFLGQVMLVLLLTALLSPGLIDLNEKLFGLLQTVVSIAAGILLLKLLSDLPRRWVANILAVLCAALLFGAALEVIGVLRDASDSFREAAFSQTESGLYASDQRDQEITGFVRPKLFTTEPSLLAIGFLVFVNSWLVLTYDKKRLAAAGAGTAMMLVLTGSPVLLLSIAASLTIAFVKEPKFISIAVVGMLVCVGGLGFALLQPELASNVTTRVVESSQNIGTLKTTSENRRVVFPYVTLVDVVKRSPLFGIGISGKELIERYSSLPIDPKYALGNNVLAMFVTYTGLVGSLLFSGAVYGFWRRAGVGDIALLVVLILALSQTMGGFETPRFWGYAFLFTGVVKMSYEMGDRRRKLTLPGIQLRTANFVERNEDPRHSVHGELRGGSMFGKGSDR